MAEDKKKKQWTERQAVPVLACLICLVCLAVSLPFPNYRAGGDRGELAEGCLEDTVKNSGDMRRYILDDMPVLWAETSAGGAAESFWEEGFTAIVEIQTGGLQGSGVIWGGSAEGILVLTAAHVLEEAHDMVRIIFGDGFEALAADIQRHEESDLASLLISWEDISEEQTEKLCRVRVNKEQFEHLQAQDKCLAVGVRTGKPEEYAGKVLDPWVFMDEYGQYMLWAEVEIKPGMSGGGLFDEQGNFLGILSGGSKDGEAAVIPLSLIMTKLLFSNQE